MTNPLMFRIPNGVEVRADIRIAHRVVGTKHVFTSPDVPGLHVSHADKQVAEDAIQPTLDMIDAMQRRIQSRCDRNPNGGDAA